MWNNPFGRTLHNVWNFLQTSATDRQTRRDARLRKEGREWAEKMLTGGESPVYLQRYANAFPPYLDAFDLGVLDALRSYDHSGD